MTTKLFLFAAFILVMFLMSVTRRKRKMRVIFFGDSITEFGEYANGYVALLRRWLAQHEAHRSYELIGAGISGNKVSDLRRRLKSDILWNGAEIVVIYIGVNDVWHKDKQKGIDRPTFGSIYRDIISELQKASIQPVLCTPTLIGENVNPLTEPNIDLEAYCDIVRSLATAFGLPIVDLREAFIRCSLEYNVDNLQAGILTTDGVHLSDAGNKLVAEEMWHVLEPLLLQHQPL